jgi:hypothetical protein
MANVYKKTTHNQIQNRLIEKVNQSTSNSMNSIILNFINYFKIKHLN